MCIKANGCTIMSRDIPTTPSVATPRLSPAAATAGGTSRNSSTMDNASEPSNYSSPENSPTPAVRKPPRADRPCDTCRKRKSRCVKEPDQEKCVLCVFHRRDCTYLDEPQRRKKRKAEAPSNPPGPAEQPAVGGPYVKRLPTLFCSRTK